MTAAECPDATVNVDSLPNSGLECSFIAAKIERQVCLANSFCTVLETHFRALT
jgi:hypothetical protein